MPVVAETYDGCLSDIKAMFVKPEHVVAALNTDKSGPVANGSAGGGNGIICYAFKGGTGKSSRQLSIGGNVYAVAIFVQANFGIRPRLTVLAVLMGREMGEGRPPRKETRSIIVISATQAPPTPNALPPV